MPKQGSGFDAIVDKVSGEGASRYVVTFPKSKNLLPGGASITFSLDKWEGDHDPTKGQVVRLFDVEKFARGWRARRAEPVRL